VLNETRHCERSEAIQRRGRSPPIQKSRRGVGRCSEPVNSASPQALDRFASLAMTGGV